MVNAFLLAFGGGLLVAGRIGDLLGHRRAFLAGIALLTVGSALAGLAPATGWLTAAGGSCRARAPPSPDPRAWPCCR